MPHHRIAALLGIASLCLLPACGSDDDSSEGGGAAPAKVALKISAAGKKSKIEAPKSLKPGLVEFSFENTDKKPHDAQLVRVDGNQSAKEIEKVIESEGGPIPPWIHGAGGLGTVPPGKTGTATDLLEPGTHYVFDTEGGGYAKIDVSGEAASAELPTTPATIKTREYRFEPSGLKAGKNRLTFENVGKELHHVIAAPLRKGATLADVKKFAATEGEGSGPPPLDFEKAVGTTVLDPGKKQVTELELQKGKYAFLCFISDRKGGPPHVAKGMVQEVEIK